MELVGGGRARGFLAFDGDRPVGWCNAAPKEMYARLHGPGDADNRIGRICCFSVAAAYRGHGLARRLLDAACDGFRRDGLTIAEAMAVPPEKVRIASMNYNGALQMYLDAGFAIVEQDEHSIMLQKQL